MSSNWSKSWPPRSRRLLEPEVGGRRQHHRRRARGILAGHPARAARLPGHRLRAPARSAAASIADGGRSINLALAARGIRGLKLAGVLDRVMPLAIPMRGRMVHEHDGAAALQMYGVRPEEVIYSVSRAELNRALIEAAAHIPNVEFRFGQLCLGLAHGQERARNARRGHGPHLSQPTRSPASPPMAPVRPCAMRCWRARWRSFAKSRWITTTRNSPFPRVDGKHALELNALHIWPRGGFMLIALPNPDATFTATLFLARTARTASSSCTRPRPSRRSSRASFPAPGADAGSHARVLRASAGLARHRVHARLAPERRRAVVRRCRARHRAVSRPGHELRVRGLRRARCG